MKKFVRVACASLSIILALGAVTGCKKDEGKSDVTTVTMWTGDGGSKAVMTEMVNEFNNTIGKEEGIKLEYIVKEGNLKEQIDLALTTEQAPDLFITSGIDKYSINGDIAAIEDMPGGEEFLKRYEGSLIPEKHTYRDKTYCLPFSTNTYGLIYNKDMFKKAGIVDKKGNAKPPETYDELRKAAKKLTNKSKKEFGIILPLKWSSWIYQELSPTTMGSYGRGYYNPLTGKYEFDVMKKPLETIMGIKKDESFYPGAENIDNDTARARFAEGGIGMKFAVSWDVGVLNDQFPAKCDWGVAPLPVEDKDNKYLQLSSQSFGPYINAYSVKSKDAEKIMTVYKWYHSDELLVKLYQAGAYIPWDYDIIKDVKVENPKKGWVEFASLNEISVVEPTAVKTDITGNPNFSNVFTNDIWTEKASIDASLKKIEKIMNDGIAKYKENNPDYDSSIAILDEWMIKR